MQNSVEIAVRGRNILVPAIQVDGKSIVVSGKLIRTAFVRDEEFVEDGVIADPRKVVEAIVQSGLRADIFTFAERVDRPAEEHPYYFEWDNAAVACTKSYTEWWDKLPQESRKNVRRAAKRGVIVSPAVFDEQLIRGIKAIYDETPVRQGRRFWHYGKDVETVRRANATYLEQSQFIGAYDEGDLVGFMKFVYVDQIANIMQILSKKSHYDKRPMNALIAKAIEICHQRGVSYLVYSKFVYGNKSNSQIADFKRRNGFVQMNYRRYFIPLTLKGRLALRFKLHRGLLGVLPPGIISWLFNARSAMLEMKNRVTPSR